MSEGLKACHDHLQFFCLRQLLRQGLSHGEARAKGAIKHQVKTSQRLLMKLVYLI